MEGSHYDTLGVADGADPEVVRRAYLDLARRLHPDRWIDAAETERADVERRMREVNEAWRVLGNPARRLAYDAGRRRHRPAEAPTSQVPFTSGDLFPVDDGPPPDAVTKLIRALPWALVALALGGIFVFTAYATAGREDADRCVAPEGRTASSVPCDAFGARVVEVRVTDVAQCPAATEPFQPAGEDLALCLRR